MNIIFGNRILYKLRQVCNLSDEIIVIGTGPIIAYTSKRQKLWKTSGVFNPNASNYYYGFIQFNMSFFHVDSERNKNYVSDIRSRMYGF